MKVQFEVNGADLTLDVAPDALLLDVLRSAGYAGVKYGCREGVCGTCTVLLDGRAVYACMTLAGQAHGRSIQTIEGVGSVAEPHPIQRAFVDAGAVQCGFCTPGMVLSTKALLASNAAPTRSEIQHALDGNLCRCTGYAKIVQGVESAARSLRGEK